MVGEGRMHTEKAWRLRTVLMRYVERDSISIQEKRDMKLWLHATHSAVPAFWLLDCEIEACFFRPELCSSFACHVTNVNFGRNIVISRLHPLGLFMSSKVYKNSCQIQL